MKTKLTLTVDKDVIANAKNYLGKTTESISSAVEKFLLDLSTKKRSRSAVGNTRGIAKKKFSNKSHDKIREEHYREKYGI